MKDSFSLFELNQHLRRVISFNMRESLWVRCEISDINFNRGFVYLSLVDRDEQRLRAKSSALIRPKDLENIKKSVGEALWSILQAGQQVLIQVSVEYTELYGISLAVKDLEAAFTVGQLELQRIATMKRLEEEQFLDLNRQLELPLVPQRVAVISSKEAAGLQDFLQHLHNNPHRFSFQTSLFQAAVQGVNVSRELVQQIDNIEAQADNFDCVVIVRGGGAKLDLMGFDDFEVCKAIATCELPVLTGIGHDVDETLADLVAHSSMKTPTAVADFLVQRVLNFEMQLNRSAIDLQQVLQRRLHNEGLLLDNLHGRLGYASRMYLQQEQRGLDLLENKLEMLLPEKTLQRGFVLLYDENGMAIKSVEQLSKGQLLRLRLQDGEVELRVE